MVSLRVLALLRHAFTTIICGPDTQRKSLLGTVLNDLKCSFGAYYLLVYTLATINCRRGTYP